jgi:hypothetical protein
VTTRPVLLVDAVGLTPRLLEHMPRLRSATATGFTAGLGTVLPALTCPVQSTLLTGALPREHGVVGNGWYFRDLGEVLLWRQHNALVAGEKLWQAARRVDPDYTVANICWWYAMGADVDWTVTPRPIYYADGRKEPDCYTYPPQLHDELTGALGSFPLFNFWGPGAGLPSSRWICAAAAHAIRRYDPKLTLVYVPHLDYDLQRHGGSGAPAARAAAELDEILDDALAPDFARLVDIHRKPGYDPAELFFDPAAPGAARRRAAVALARKKLGMRYLMSVVGLDAGAARVRGSHGRLPADPADAPVLLCSDPAPRRATIAATEVKDLVLGLARLT